MLPHINTQAGISIYLRGRPRHVSANDKHYKEILDAVQQNAPEQVILDILDSVRKLVEAACRLTETMEYSGGIVKYKGETLGGYAVEKLVGLIHAKMDVTPLARFLEKLQENPSNQTVKELYTFLEHGSMPINNQGNFLAYKAVRADYKDIHSGTFDNHIGATLVMPRRNVDDRRENTCSHGFHVCSYEYLPHFAHSNGGHIMICEVNPADVVSIPADYNNTKMRVCAYRVIGEDENWQPKDRDTLRSIEVWDECYDIYDVTDTDPMLVSSFDSLEEAMEDARELEEDGVDVRIENSSGIVVYRS